jgi:hypothetical protein
MKKVTIFLFLITASTIGYSQENLSDQLVLDSLFEPKLTGETYIAKSGLIGSQFYNDDWAASDILLSTGQKVYDKLLRYNGLLDEVVWLMPENFKQVKLDKLAINEFVFKNFFGKKVKFKRMNTNEQLWSDSTDIFAEVAYEGKLSLFIRRNVKVVGFVSQENKGSMYTYEQLAPSPVYYFKLANKKIVILQRLKRRMLLKLFPEQKIAIRKLLRQNHQKLSSEMDLINIVMLLNKNIFN